MGIQLGGLNAVGSTCPDLLGLPLVDTADPVYQDISAAPVHPNSAGIIRQTCTSDGGASWPNYLTNLFHPTRYGYPFQVVPGNQPLVPLDFYPATGYPQFSTPTAPLPDALSIEGSPSGDATPTDFANDQHVFVVVRDETTGGVAAIYELYSVYKPTPGAHWTVTRTAWTYTPASKYTDRPEGWPTTTAGGTRLMPCLVTYEDVYVRKVINHALRMTVLQLGGVHTSPARSNATGSRSRIPAGARVRLRPDFVINGFSPGCQVVLTALKKFGAFIDDSGANFEIAGTRDARWLPYEFSTELQTIAASNLQVLDFGYGYTVTPPASLSGLAGVESGVFSCYLNSPTAGVGVNGGDVGGFTFDDGGAGGVFKINGVTNYRVNLTATATGATFTYTPRGSLAPGTAVNLGFTDSNLYRIVPPPIVYTVGPLVPTPPTKPPHGPIPVPAGGRVLRPAGGVSLVAAIVTENSQAELLEDGTPLLSEYGGFASSLPSTSRATVRQVSTPN